MSAKKCAATTLLKIRKLKFFENQGNKIFIDGVNTINNNKKYLNI